MAADSYFTDVKWPLIRSLAYGCQLRCRFTSDKKTTAHRHPAAATPTLFLFSFCLFFDIFSIRVRPAVIGSCFKKSPPAM